MAAGLLRLALVLGAGLALSAAADSGGGGLTCPFEYERHSLESILSGAQRPWLWDGAYHNFDSTDTGGRFCVNCHRGSLFPTWCGRRPTKQPYWDLQLCQETITRMAIDEAGKHDDIRGALTMTPCDLHSQLAGRTLWIIGDSMSKDLIKAYKCFMIEFWDLQQYHITNNFTAMHHLHSLPGYGEPNCIHMVGGGRMCQIHAIQGDLFVNTTRAVSGVLPLIMDSGLVAADDVIVLNFGLWHGEVVRPAYVQHLHELGRFYASRRDKFPHVFFMETPKQHFAGARDGDFQTEWLSDPVKKKGPYTCGPVAGVRYNGDGSLSASGDDPVASAVAGGTWRNVDARAILRDGYGMRLVPVYNTTVAFWNMHRSNFAGTECSHYCHPSVPQLWLWVLHRTLADAGVVALPAKDGPPHRSRQGCALFFERDETQLGLPKPVEKVYAEADARREATLREQHGFLWRLFHMLGRGRRRRLQIRLP